MARAGRRPVMWTAENRPKYDRSKLRYPSDVTDEEWAIIAPLIPPAKRGGNKRTIDERAVVDGVMYILSTGCQGAALPKDLPPRSTVNDYLRRREDGQGQEASCPCRHPGPADAGDHPRRRHPGPRRRRAADGFAVRPLPLPAEAVRRQWI